MRRSIPVERGPWLEVVEVRLARAPAGQVVVIPSQSQLDRERRRQPPDVGHEGADHGLRQVDLLRIGIDGIALDPGVGGHVAQAERPPRGRRDIAVVVDDIRPVRIGAGRGELEPPGHQVGPGLQRVTAPGRFEHIAQLELGFRLVEHEVARAHHRLDRPGRRDDRHLGPREITRGRREEPSEGSELSAGGIAGAAAAERRPVNQGRKAAHTPRGDVGLRGQDSAPLAGAAHGTQRKPKGRGLPRVPRLIQPAEELDAAAVFRAEERRQGRGPDPVLVLAGKLDGRRAERAIPPQRPGNIASQLNPVKTVLLPGDRFWDPAEGNLVPGIQGTAGPPIAEGVTSAFVAARQGLQVDDPGGAAAELRAVAVHAGVDPPNRTKWQVHPGPAQEALIVVEAVHGVLGREGIGAIE